MTLGLTVSILVTFSLLPSLLNIFADNNDIQVKDSEKSKITSALSTFAKGNTNLIFSSAILVVILSIYGISKLEVENSFINYFDEETEIYKGMKKIDDDLGGTTT